MARTGARERIIEAAAFLFWERGYERCSIAEIVQRAGVLSGSLYHCFKSKEEVLLAVLDWYRAGLRPTVIDPPFARTADPIERIFEVLRDYRERLVATDFTYRCPIGSLALEMQNASPAARAAIVDNFSAWRAAIAACVVAARSRLRRGADASSLATFVLTTMEGGVMQAAAERSIRPYDESVAHLRAYFELLSIKPAKKG